MNRKVLSKEKEIEDLKNHKETSKDVEGLSERRCIWIKLQSKKFLWFERKRHDLSIKLKKSNTKRNEEEQVFF